MSSAEQRLGSIAGVDPTRAVGSPGWRGWGGGSAALAEPARAGLLGVILLAACARLAILREFLLENPFAWLPRSDGAYYWDWAELIAAGAWLFDGPFYTAPLYAYTLGALRALGAELPLVYSAQLGLHLATAALVAAAVRVRLGPACGLGAAALFLCLGEPALYVSRISPTTLQLFLAALLWREWARLSEAPERGAPSALRVGAALGLLALAFPAAQLLVPLYAAWLLADRSGWRRRAHLAAAGVAGAALLAAPATLHNHAASGDLVWISANAGVVLAHGNAPGSVGIHTPVAGIGLGIDSQQRDATKLYEAAHGRAGRWSEVDRWLRGRVVAAWRDDPVGALELFARKLLWTLASRDYDNVTAFSLEREHGLGDAAVLAPVAVPWLVGLGLLGGVAALAAPRRFAPELALVGLALLVCVAFHFSGRFRLLGAPALCGLSLLALRDWRRLPVPGWLRWALIGLPIALLAADHATGFTRLDFMRQDFARAVADAQRKLGQRELEAGNGPEALRRFALAVASRPADPHARWLLYDAHAEQGDAAAALEQLEVLVQQAPDDVGVRFALAWLRAAAGDDALRDGKRALEQARALESSTGGRFPGAFTVLAMAQAELGRFEQAAESARQGAALARELGDEGAARELERLGAHVAAGRPVRARPVRLGPPGAVD